MACRPAEEAGTPDARAISPVLHVDYHPAVDRDVHLDGRGMLLVA
ncbi:hypothetical protein WBG99_12875 [Streptomyces sp. TG1A-60]